MKNKKSCLFLSIIAGLTWLVVDTAESASTCGAQLSVARERGQTVLTLEGSIDDSVAFHTTQNHVSEQRLVAIPSSHTCLILWNESTPDGETIPFYAISRAPDTEDTERKAEFAIKATATSYDLKLRHGDFDPLYETPKIVGPLLASEQSNLHIVQFLTQPLAEYRSAIEALGGTVLKFLAHHAYIVLAPDGVELSIAALPFVRWVGPCHPAYRVEESVPSLLNDTLWKKQQRRYNLQVFQPADKAGVASRITGIGARVDAPTAGIILIEASLTGEELLAAAHWDEIAFIDLWSPLEADMNNARETGGANFIETVAGYTGSGVRGEVFDAGFNVGHADFQSRPLIQHNAVPSDSHGAATSGICFGDGSANPNARGLLPDGQGIVAYYDTVGQYGTGRYTHTAELLLPPYEAVFQTSSVGSDRTFNYTTISAEHDAMLFDLDILHCQSQSNAGNQDSRPQAWAKNVVSGGGADHQDTLSRSDDCWCSGGSIGPASDGRIKPDLYHYYDSILTTTTGGTTSYTSSFGGTSGATPIVCGYFGLFFEMWADGIFGNPVNPLGSVFDNRPHMATAKAMVINTASPADFSGPDDDMTRVHQGWGMPDLQSMYELRDKTGVIDETEVLENLESVVYFAVVEDGQQDLRATLVYTDPAGLPLSSQHRVNDLTLKMTNPLGVVYWGNNGLLDGIWTPPGGAADTINTVENIFVNNPLEGVWQVEVYANEVNEDSHVETPEVDADFALVVTGAFFRTCSSAGVLLVSGSSFGCSSTVSLAVADCDLNLDDNVVENTSVLVVSDSQPAGLNVVLTEVNALAGTFAGEIQLSETAGAGVLQVQHGDDVTVTYIDADDGQGHLNVTRTKVTPVDCVSPQITGVTVTDVGPRTATIGFATDEPSTATVHYGASCQDLSQSTPGSGVNQSHSISLTGLIDDSNYFLAVEAIDTAGNSTLNTNNGDCYSFTTTDVPDFFTGQLGLDPDLGFTTLTLIPHSSIDFYEACLDPAVALPTDPSGATALILSDDDSELVSLGAGATVLLYGTSYSGLYVGSNGYVTFGQADTSYDESFDVHFQMPRVSGVFDDLNPSSGGTVSTLQLADRIAVTWQDVPQYSQSDANTFQVELFFDGMIRITWQEIPADGIVGLSEGNGLSPDFMASLLSASQECGALGSHIFSDGLESGDTSAWSGLTP